MPVILIVSAFAALVASGSAPRASIAMGQGDHDKAERILGGSFTLQILDLPGADGGAPPLGGRPPPGLRRQRQHHRLRLGLPGRLRPRHPLRPADPGHERLHHRPGLRARRACGRCSSAPSPTSLLDPLFIFALGMGVRGAALATVLSQALSCAWVLRFLTGEKTLLRLKRETLRLQPRLILPCVALGLSAFVMQASESVISVCFNTSLLKVRRRHRRGGHDHPLQRDAVRHAAPPGHRPGGPAHPELQLRRPEQRPGPGDLPPAAEDLPHLLRHPLGRHPALPPALRGPLQYLHGRATLRRPSGSTARCSSSSASRSPAR